MKLLKTKLVAKHYIQDLFHDTKISDVDIAWELAS
jgi:hypothetical protein